MNFVYNSIERANAKMLFAPLSHIMHIFMIFLVFPPVCIMTTSLALPTVPDILCSVFLHIPAFIGLTTLNNNKEYITISTIVFNNKQKYLKNNKYLFNEY